ncbi:hypothetical protein QIH93_15145 [Bradyrhizobium ottawaense]|jgi:hypothetical protein|uniref:hypothetical protein n=1 Tax=Bradyrhizobium ottawaense TaxID=931866 RepID=UPI0027144CA9|nr:hypothetical protein [Bradyrhizobium ottawaense]WLB49249.1 hypothetical protein QIH93_15145 [Bradyrhizobium ottawaense]
MRFLEEHELPAWERERRKALVEAIELGQKVIKEQWEAAAPRLLELIERGQYEAEREYRAAILRSQEPINREMVLLRSHLPPFMECREDEILEMVPQPLPRCP